MPPPRTVTPTPPPSPAPSPTQTVVVNLPPDVVNKLSPHESGLPQSWATIIAADIAVSAALIALAGVWWQIRSAAREARRDRGHDARLARQPQLVERMGESIALTRSLQDLLGHNTRAPLRGWDEADKDAFNEQTQRATALSSMLQVLGAEKSGGAFWRLTYLLNIIANENERGTPSSKSQRLDGKSTLQLRSEMMTAFRIDLSEQTEPARTEADGVEPHY